MQDSTWSHSQTWSAFTHVTTTTMLCIVATLLRHTADSPTLLHFPPSSGPDQEELVLTKRDWRSNHTDEEHWVSANWCSPVAQMTYRSWFCNPGEEVNPMAPSLIEQQLGSQTIENHHFGRPQPRLHQGPLSATVSHPPQPSFNLAAGDQQFGFRLPGTSQVSRGQIESTWGSVDSVLSSSCPSTTFSNASCPSTALTSRAASACLLSQGDPDIRQQSTPMASLLTSKCWCQHLNLVLRPLLEFLNYHPEWQSCFLLICLLIHPKVSLCCFYLPIDLPS